MSPRLILIGVMDNGKPPDVCWLYSLAQRSTTIPYVESGMFNTPIWNELRQDRGGQRPSESDKESRV